MRILLLSHRFHPDIGGIETTSEILATKFIEAGHQVRILTWTLDTTQKLFAFTVIRNPSLKILYNQHLWAEVVLENNPCLRLAWPLFFFRRPSVIALQTWLSRTDGTIGWPDRLKRIWLKRSAYVIACSNAVGIKCWPTAIIIENPYKESIFKIRPTIQRRMSFVFLGRLVSDKGADLAIKAFSRLFYDNKISYLGADLSLTLIGDGPEREHLEGLVFDLGLTERVTFQGALQGDRLVNELNQYQFLLVPSQWEEPFGIVVLEGMACGCIPIVADGGGLPDAVGDAGLTFTRGYEHSLVNCMKKLLNDPALQERLRSAAPRHLLAHRQSVVAEKYLNVLKRALSSNVE